MTDSAPNRISSLTQDVNVFDVIVHLKKHKWLYLLLLLIVGFSSFSYFKGRVFRYSSSASFYLNDNPSSSMSSSAETRPIDMSITGENFNRVYQLAHSTKVYDHLIEKFNLYQHYGLDPKGEFSYPRIITMLGACIEVKKSQFDLVTVTVKDPSRYLAADMANDIVAFLDQLNKDLIIQSLNIKLNIYKNLIVDIRNQSTMNTGRIDSLLRELNTLFPHADEKSIHSSNLMAIQQRLSSMIAAMESSESDLLKLQRYYSLGMETINLQSLPTLIIMQVALPSPYSNNSPTATLTILTMVLTFMMMIIFIILGLRYSKFIVALWKA